MLEQNYSEKEVFFLSKDRRKLTVEELVTNLSKLLTNSHVTDANLTENRETLVGKRIRHKWCVDGIERWFTGQILSAVDGTNEWFNVQYDGEQEALTLNLYEDIDNGDLDIIA